MTMESIGQQAIRFVRGEVARPDLPDFLLDCASFVETKRPRVGDCVLRGDILLGEAFKLL